MTTGTDRQTERLKVNHSFVLMVDVCMPGSKKKITSNDTRLSSRSKKLNFKLYQLFDGLRFHFSMLPVFVSPRQH